jgi:CcmD family protein
MDSTLPYLAAAFIAIWIALGAYLVRMWTVQRRLAARIAELERRQAATEG